MTEKWIACHCIDCTVMVSWICVLIGWSGPKSNSPLCNTSFSSLVLDVWAIWVHFSRLYGDVLDNVLEKFYFSVRYLSVEFPFTIPKRYYFLIRISVAQSRVVLGLNGYFKMKILPKCNSYGFVPNENYCSSLFIYFMAPQKGFK